MRFSGDTAVQPDLLFVRAERWDELNVGGYLTGAPDIVVEGVSPSSGAWDRVCKFGLYADNNVAEYWIVDPKRQEVTVHTLLADLYQPVAADADGSLTSRVLPDLTIAPTHCFTRPGSSRGVPPDR